MKKKRMVHMAALPALLDGWAALCSAAGRRSLSAGRALTAGTAEQREAVALALVALGYPEAWRTGPSLGGALRSLRHRRGSDGRCMSMSFANGSSIWYVTTLTAGTEPVAT